MKKITFTLLFTLLIISIGSGQNLLTNGDFEAGATGWAGNALNSVDDGSGTNKRNEANIAAAGDPWDVSLTYPGLVLEAGETYTLSYTAYTDATTATRSMAAGIGKNAPDWNSLTDSPALTATATTFTYTYTVNYPNPENSRVVFDMGAQAGFVFIDDVSLTKVTPAPIVAPTVAAPSPPVRNAADVVSIYSDVYDAISPINYDEAWCGAGAVTATTADGDNVFAYNGNNCQGISFAGDKQDVTGLTNMHVDLFIAEGTDLAGKVFNVKIVYSAGGESSFNIDINALSPAPVPGTWYSYDALVSITGSNIQQVGITSNLNNVVWYDNLYFWKEAVDPATDTTLSDLTVDGTTVTGFKTDKLTYNIILSKGTTVVPTLVGTPTQSSPATAVTTAAAELPGTSTVLVTAQDGSTTETYTVNFTVDTNTECAGNSSEAQQGSFSADYSYGFETLTNGDVRLTFAMPSGTPGLVAYAWKQTPFAETSMTVSGTVATLDIAGYSNGESISYAVKFAWAAGGFGVTKYFTYIVGDACALGTNKFDLASFKAYPNPTKDTWTVTTKNTNISSIQVYDVLGRNVLSLKPNAIEAKIDASSLKTGVYFVKINTLNGSSSLKLVKE